MARKARSTVFSMKWALSLLIGVILVPGALSIGAGIVSLALWQDAEDIVTGVLVICFAAMVLGGSIATIVLMRRWQRLARLQADFVANISHEVRTPLTAIRLFAETLRLGRFQDEEERERLLDALVEESERLHVLLEQLLQWRRMSMGTEVYAPSPQRMRELVDAALSPWPEPAIGGERRAIAVTLPADLPPVLADGPTMTKAVQNLVDNALKYGTPDDAPRVVVGTDQARGRVTISVSDRGPGIPTSEQRRIFDRFYRGEGVRRDASKPGTGLGLSIVSEIVRAHRGELRLESEEGSGSTFTIVLPAAADDATDAEGPTEDASEEATRGEPATSAAPEQRPEGLIDD